MLTAEDIAGISIFAGLGPSECDRLSRNAADIRLVPGEFAVHEGDERALFAVLEGRLETVASSTGYRRSLVDARQESCSARCRSRSGRRFRSGSALPNRRV